MPNAKSISLFIVAGLLEIGGVYFVWPWWRSGPPLSIGVLGAVALSLYGIVPTYEPAHFGQVYAAYGGWFVVLSLLWGQVVDKTSPDRFDIIGGALCPIGVGVIMYWPR